MRSLFVDDLLLFQLLRVGASGDERLLPLLDAAAKVPLDRRVAFLGVLSPAIVAERAEVRAAALRVLAGSNGPIAVRWAVRALADADDQVRNEAVEVLRAIASDQPARWAHVVFHPDASVRLAAARGATSKAAAALELYLLADDVSAPEIRRRFPSTKDESAPRLSVPRDAWPTILDFAATGVLSREDARDAILEMPWDGLDRWLEASRTRSDVDLDAALAAIAAGNDTAAAERDDVDDLLALFWPDDPSGEAAFAKVAATLRGWSGTARKRVVVSLATLGKARGWPAPALELLVELEPRALATTRIAKAARRAAVEVFLRREPHRVDDEALKSLLALDLCTKDDGKLDLHVVGALLRLAKDNPYEKARALLDADRVLDALVADVAGSIPFLTLDDASVHGRKAHLDRLREVDRALAAMAAALLALELPLDKLAFVEEMSLAEAMEVLDAFLRRDVATPPDLDSKRADRLGKLFADMLDEPSLARFVRTWLAAEPPCEMGAHVFVAMAKTMEGEPFVARMVALPIVELEKVLEAIAACTAFPFGKEMALARALAEHDDGNVRAWAKKRLPIEGAATPPPRPRKVVPLTADLASRIASVADVDLPAALAPALGGGFSGVADALARRPPPSSPSIPACLALLVAMDPMRDVDRELLRFGSDHPAFLAALDRAMVETHLGTPLLPPLAHAWLSRWDRHAYAFEESIVREHGSFPLGIDRAMEMRSPTRREVMEAVGRLFALHAYREKARLHALVDERLGEVLVRELATDAALGAASALVHLHRSGLFPARMDRRASAARLVLPDVPAEARARLASWLDSRGLPAAAAKKREIEIDEATIARIRRLSDLDELARLCGDDRARVVHEAALRLIELGEPGENRLATILETASFAPSVRPLLDSIPLWSHPSAVASVRALVPDASRPPEIRFRAAVALLERREAIAVDALVAPLLVPCDASFFRPEDAAKLEALGVDPFGLACRLAASPHPHAYIRSVEALLAGSGDEDLRKDAIRAFLRAGSERMGSLRRRAAAWLHDHGDVLGFPILLEGQLDDAAATSTLLRAAPRDVVVATAVGMLAAGRKVAKESALFRHLSPKHVDEAGRAEALEILLDVGTVAKVRKDVVDAVEKSPFRTWKLRKIAETFAWGVRMGRELTGRLFKVQMVSGKGLGHTRMRENRIFVTALPILRRERNAQEIVEGLLLHEIGHHVHHRGDVAEETWDEAQKAGMHGLLNLVADEHLERNLRAVDAGFGDRLKILAAYAFQHADREIAVSQLETSLQARTFEVLVKTPLGVARDEQSVSIDNGALLHQMEAAGLSFPRFVRALRMGLGNRHDDPLVERGLALFRGNFRKNDMRGLWAIAKELRAIFGWQVRLVETFGPHESLEGDDAERTIHGDGISDDEIQGEVERVLNPKARKPTDAGKGPPGKPWINVNPSEQFAPITNVVKVPFDPVEHAKCAREVARPAGHMKRFLEDLGLKREPAKRRLQGLRFDPSRTQAMILRNDPRVLVARETHVRADLFLGIVVDCSGSMQTGALIERAKLFATLLAEAGRDLPGIDVRLFGFTDRVVYDAGDARHCAAHGLRANGGNNDAAALWHVASVARASRRRSKLLVMISDGLPTECSAAALKAVVNHLTKREHMVCAQVAVRPLAEICFPHYVLLEEGDQTIAVRKFGTTIGTLVKRTLQG